MQVEAVLVPAESELMDLEGKTAVVIDVLRASSTMTTALANGCAAFVPVPDLGSAFAAAEELRREGGGNVLLGGERGGRRQPGFDLGNSPLEYTAEAVSGKSVVFTTTNGTAALLASRAAEEILIGCFLNLQAVCGHIRDTGRPAVLVAAGTHGRISMDDTLCAGMLAAALVEAGYAPADDGARAALALAGAAAAHPLRDELLAARHGGYLEDIGFAEDIEYCSRVNTFSLVPRARVSGGRIVVGV